MELLIVPVFLALGAYWLNLQRKRSDRSLEMDRAREASLQDYLDVMTDLFLERGLRSSEPKSDLQGFARARTLTVLSGLDGVRKARLIRFLYQMNAISTSDRIIDLSGADLNGIDLSGSDISGNRDRTFFSYLSLADVQFFGVNLREANLAEAKMSGASLFMADLTDANLEGAHLMFADIRLSTLSGTRFRGTNLTGADLTGATGLSDKQLRLASSLKEVTMPDGSQAQ